MLLACEARLGETSELETLTEMIENRIVHVEDGRICPNFAEISDKDYMAIAGKLSEEIGEMADVAAKIRDTAADILAARVPKEYAEAREIGGIVSMWSLLENVVSVILETGYLTRGSDEQNVTTFYFKN